MDKPWWAAVHGVASQTDLATKQQQIVREPYQAIN